MSSHAQPRLAPVIRPATEADLLPIARVFLNGLDTSLPHRKLATDFYVWERDAVAFDGRLRRRLERELARGHVVVAIVGEEGRVGGYVNWSAPRTVDGRYKPGEINFLFVDPTLHGRGLGSVLLSHVLSEARAVYATIMHATEVVMGVHCFSANAVGMRVYQGRGFVMKSEEVDPDTNESMSYLELSESK